MNIAVMLMTLNFTEKGGVGKCRPGAMLMQRLCSVTVAVITLLRSLDESEAHGNTL